MSSSDPLPKLSNYFGSLKEIVARERLGSFSYMYWCTACVCFVCLVNMNVEQDADWNQIYMDIALGHEENWISQGHSRTKQSQFFVFLVVGDLFSLKLKTVLIKYYSSKIESCHCYSGVLCL